MYIIILHKRNGDSEAHSYTFGEAQEKLDYCKSLGYSVRANGRVFYVEEAPVAGFYVRDAETGEWEAI